jgi:hypothetical protein
MSSTSTAHDLAFYRELMRSRRVWTVMDESGLPAPISAGGRAIPFWSTLKRVELVLEKVSAFRGFTAVELDIDVFFGQWLTGLARDQMRVGLNWSGEGVVCYDVDPKEVSARLLALGAIQRSADS